MANQLKLLRPVILIGLFFLSFTANSSTFTPTGTYCGGYNSPENYCLGIYGSSVKTASLYSGGSGTYVRVVCTGQSSYLNCSAAHYAQCVSPNTWSNAYSLCTVSVQCTLHQHLDNDVCVADPPITCPANQHDDGTYTCVADPPLTCPANQHDDGTYTCVADPPLTCPANQHDDGTYTCVPDAPLTCPDGQYDDGTYTCVNNPPIICPDGSHNDGSDNCVLDVVESIDSTNFKIPRLYFTQQLSGKNIITRFSTVSGTPIETIAGENPLTPYVGLIFDAPTGNLYYTYKVMLDFNRGSYHKMPVDVKIKVSYDSLADLIIWDYPNLTVASNDYFQFLTDFFISSAEANPFLYFVVVPLLTTAANIYFSDNTWHGEPEQTIVPGTGCTLHSMQGRWATASEACDALALNHNHDGSYHLTPYVITSSESATTGICVTEGTQSSGSFTCRTTQYQYTYVPWQPWQASKKFGAHLKSRAGAGGMLGDVAGTLLDLGMGAWDYFKDKFGWGSPSSDNPGGTTKMPTTKDDYAVKNPDAEIKAPDDKKVDIAPEKDLGQDVKTDPDGSQQKTDEKIKNDVESGSDGDSIVSTIERVVTAIDALGQIVSQRTENETPDPMDIESSSNNSDLCQKNPDILACSNWKKMCEENPDIIGCSKWGDEPTPETIETHEVQVSLTPDAAPVGTCPAGLAFSLSQTGGSGELSFEPICEFAGYIKPIMIMFAFLASGYMLFGVVKEN